MLSLGMSISGVAPDAEMALDVINPAIGEVFAQCQAGNAAHVNQAVSAARVAFSSWSRTPNAERKALLLKLAAVLETNMAELMQLVTQETGKPMAGLNGVGSGMEVGGAMAWIQYTANLDLPVEVIQDDDRATIEVHRKPLGVVASITPWNWPLLIAIWHVIPALKAGNTVVIKPSEFTPLSTLRFVELANEVLPAGVLNCVTGGADVGVAISNHQDINKIVFTGSTPTGRKVMQAASGSFKRLTLELGGNDAGIVLPGANVEAIASKVFGVAFHNNGQTCAALKRLYVHESQYEEMCRVLAELANRVKVGNGVEESTDLGPLQNLNQLNIVKELAEDARRVGGRFLCGGEALAGPGFFFPPTIVADLSNGHRLVDEEQFGPILPIIKYADVDEAIALANDNPNGLGGSVWSSDLNVAAEVARQLECGSVWVNDHGSVQPDMPFGGIKNSGIGVEFGRYGLEEYTSIQSVKVVR